MGIQQLYNIIPDLELMDYFNAELGEVKLYDANNTPFIRLPNGMPCLMANAYMISLLKKNMSRINKGGTLRAYAKDLTHIIRFCHNRKIDFYQLNDDLFTHFISELRKERSPSNPAVRKRESNTLNAIGHVTLTFLAFVGKMHGDDSFITENIRAEKRSYRLHHDKSKTRYVDQTSWYHTSFDTPGPVRHRSPISTISIQLLYEAIPKQSSKDNSKQDKKLIDRRRTIMIRLLEMTGARIEELANLQDNDIEVALRQKDPKLRLITLKRGESAERYIPVLSQDLAMIKSYVRVIRKKTIKDTIGTKNDHGYIFISVKSGKRLSSEYMSNEIGLLQKTAGISSQICAHMFRNRFITKMFARLINQYNYENKDEFRRALLDTNALKREIQQYTGHIDVNSLDTYIDLAFNEIANLDFVVSIVHLQAAYEAFDSHLEQLHRELKSGLSIPNYLEKYSELVELRVADVGRISLIEKSSEE